MPLSLRLVLKGHLSDPAGASQEEAGACRRKLGGGEEAGRYGGRPRAGPASHLGSALPLHHEALAPVQDPHGRPRARRHLHLAALLHVRVLARHGVHQGPVS